MWRNRGFRINIDIVPNLAITATSLYSTFHPSHHHSITKMTTPVQQEKVDAEVEQLEVLEKAKAQANGGNGDVMLIGEDGHVRRIPIPSSDPNDPLSFSKWRKLGILISCCWFSIFSLVLVGGLGPILAAFFALYGPEGKSTQAVVNLTTFPSLVMAFGVSWYSSLRNLALT